MQKSALLIAGLCCLLAACEDVEQKAGEKLLLARQALEAGRYDEAKTQIDSIKILYPKAFETRRAGIYLMQDIELAEQQKTLAWLEEQFGKQVKIVRTMPNTPAMVGAGMTAACPNPYLSEEEIAYVKTLLQSFSRVEIIPERLMDVVVSTSGSSPAYVFMMIEAMADAAVSGGMPRPQAYQFAAQAVLGSAKMVLDTGKHPGELKDMVCSPAGTTIEAVRVLEERGFRSAIIEAMKVCEEISKNM